jgi:hypothetical protein|nr:hypothetical protein [Kofleriaceae bacterium]
MVARFVPLLLAVVAAACSPEEAPNGGFPFDCQPLCQDATGNLLGSPMDITVKATDQDEASTLCVEQATGSDYCPAGQTIPRCSCDLGSGS